MSFERNTLGFSPQAERAVAEMCDHRCTAIKGRLMVARLKRRPFTIRRVETEHFSNTGEECGGTEGDIQK